MQIEEKPIISKAYLHYGIIQKYQQKTTTPSGLHIDMRKTATSSGVRKLLMIVGRISSYK